MGRRHYQGKFLFLKIVTTLLILLFLMMPYFSSIPHSISSFLIPITIIFFFVIDYLLVKRALKDK
ncbi:hypothetical protein AMD00_12300 [Viridibacillus arvi]|uniref:Uncharacterized protein n=1 Tax=Viridibacillus arvi TaxID=263475 RepID=A0A0M0LE25_9BACL|nr:hypothetical protein AMD00_12300 [Viridibacillus arvi]